MYLAAAEGAKWYLPHILKRLREPADWNGLGLSRCFPGSFPRREPHLSQGL